MYSMPIDCFVLFDSKHTTDDLYGYAIFESETLPILTTETKKVKRNNLITNSRCICKFNHTRKYFDFVSLSLAFLPKKGETTVYYNFYDKNLVNWLKRLFRCIVFLSLLLKFLANGQIDFIAFCVTQYKNVHPILILILCFFSLLDRNASLFGFTWFMRCLCILCSAKTITDDCRYEKRTNKFVTSHSSATNVKMARISRKRFDFKAIWCCANVASLT